MNESKEFDQIENVLRSQSLGIAPPDVAALMYRCGEAAARETSGQRAARRHRVQVGLAAIFALVAGIALDRTAFHGGPPGAADPNVAAAPYPKVDSTPRPERDEVLLDPHILRTSSRWVDGLELADVGWSAARPASHDAPLDAENLAPTLRVVDLREQLRDSLAP